MPKKYANPYDYQVDFGFIKEAGASAAQLVNSLRQLGINKQTVADFNSMGLAEAIDQGNDVGVSEDVIRKKFHRTFTPRKRGENYEDTLKRWAGKKEYWQNWLAKEGQKHQAQQVAEASQQVMAPRSMLPADHASQTGETPDIGLDMSGIGPQPTGPVPTTREEYKGQMAGMVPQDMSMSELKQTPSYALQAEALPGSKDILAKERLGRRVKLDEYKQARLAFDQWKVEMADEQKREALEAKIVPLMSKYKVEQKTLSTEIKQLEKKLANPPDVNDLDYFTYDRNAIEAELAGLYEEQTQLDNVISDLQLLQSKTFEPTREKVKRSQLKPPAAPVNTISGGGTNDPADLGL
jgi:hypothetical protein